MASGSINNANSHIQKYVSADGRITVVLHEYFVIISGSFVGNGTANVNITLPVDIPNAPFGLPCAARGSGDGKIATYYVFNTTANSINISGWDGSTNRIFNSGNGYTFSIVYGVAQPVPTNMATGNISNEKKLYSFEETICGTWIDGSPIYRKTLILPNGTYNKNWGYDLHPANGGTVPSFSRIINTIFTISNEGIDNYPYSNAFVLMRIDHDTNVIVLNDVSGPDTLRLKNSNNYVTIEYLK